MVPEKYLVATDVVVITDDEQPEVLLIQRKNPPYQNAWALPGGFVERDEDLPEGALRELAEETGIILKEAVQIGAYGKPGRDPRGRVISIAFTACVKKQNLKPKAADDAKNVAWHSVAQLPPLAFDHAQIIADALKRIK